jgi:hypothetical protein
MTTAGDFLEQMHLAVVEEAWLAEVPLGGTDYVGPARRSRTDHGIQTPVRGYCSGGSMPA